jgi:hypothetical protein
MTGKASMVSAGELKMTSGAEDVCGPQPAADCQRPGTPEQLRTYKLTVRVIAELYPPLTNERRWAFQNAVALSRGLPLIRAAARWDKLDEATVTIECRARDAAAAAGEARRIIRRTAGFTGEIGVRDIKVIRVAPAGWQFRAPAARDPFP